MIAELCMNTGWSFRDVMGMPMIAFISFIAHTKKIADDRLSLLLLELTDVQSIALGNSERYEGLREHYKSRLLSKEQNEKRASPHRFNMEVQEQADQAAQIMTSVLKVKKKIMGL